MLHFPANTECCPSLIYQSEHIFLRKQHMTEKCNLRYTTQVSENTIFFMALWQTFCNSLGVTFVQKNVVFGFFGFYSCRQDHFSVLHSTLFYLSSLRFHCIPLFWRCTDCVQKNLPSLFCYFLRGIWSFLSYTGIILQRKVQR